MAVWVLIVLLVVTVLALVWSQQHPRLQLPMQRVDGAIELSMRPSTTFSEAGYTLPVFMLIKLPIETTTGRTVTVDADADTGSSDLVLVTSACDSCYCVSRQCVKWPIRAPGRVPGSKVLTYGQGSYPVKYWTAQLKGIGLKVYLAGIVGVGKGLKQVQSVCGLRPKNNALSLVNTVYKALPQGVPRSLVFDTVQNKLVLGARQPGTELPLLPHPMWYVVPVHRVHYGNKLVKGVTAAVIDTGTSVTAGPVSLRNQLLRLNANSNLTVDLGDGVVLDSPMPKKDGKLPLWMTISQLKPHFIVMGLNSLLGRVITFDWERQTVTFG